MSARGDRHARTPEQAGHLRAVDGLLAPAARTVLVVDENARTRAFLGSLVERAGARAVEAGDGVTALRTLWQKRPDLVLLAATLPHDGSWWLIDRIRSLTDVPVVVFGGDPEAAIEIEIRALRAGADHFLAAPLDPDAVTLRMQALLRRHAAHAPPAVTHSDASGLEFDYQRAEARVHGEPVPLTRLELRLLGTLIRHGDRVLSAEQLLELVWGDPELGRQRVKLVVASLRAKLRAAGLVHDPIRTVRGFGYRFEPVQTALERATQRRFERSKAVSG
jgi:DNA-binding response OmpR family regulator